MSISIKICFVFRFCDFKYLSITDIGAAGNAKKNKNRGEYPFQSQPFVQIVPYKKTKNDAAGHGQSQLHDKGQIFRPIPVFLIVEQTVIPWCCISRLFIRRRIPGRTGYINNLKQNVFFERKEDRAPQAQLKQNRCAGQI